MKPNYVYVLLLSTCDDADTGDSTHTAYSLRLHSLLEKCNIASCVSVLRLKGHWLV